MAEFLKLTAETYPELLMLPQTFQDAVKEVLQISVKLLWIDSLCIFQGSVEDWQE